ncbi:MAG: hypothetical protein ACW98D_08065 [Promethearchaeota archaeon]|jgi:hypothetical protein
MKKTKILGITFISTLIILSLTNVSHAAPPSYVGISTGQSFTWVGTANIANINSTGISLLGQDNWTMIYSMLDEMVFNETGLNIGSLLAGGIKASIKNVSDEISMPPLSGAWVFAELSVSFQPGIWETLTDGSTPTLVIVNPTGVDITNYHYALMGGGAPPLFLPTGLDFNQLATWISSNISSLDPSMIPIYNNVTVTALSDGLKATVLGLIMSLNGSTPPFPIPTFNNIDVEVRWNANGVFSSAKLDYGGLTLVSAELVPDGAEIPGFILPIFLGAGAVGLVGAIILVKRKKGII